MNLFTQRVWISVQDVIQVHKRGNKFFMKIRHMFFKSECFLSKVKLVSISQYNTSYIGGR